LKLNLRRYSEDDLQHIAGLQQDVRYLSSQCAGLESDAKQQTLRLENRNTNDAVFGRGSLLTLLSPLSSLSLLSLSGADE
jgi:hypothetical protein